MTSPKFAETIRSRYHDCCLTDSYEDKGAESTLTDSTRDPSPPSTEPTISIASSTGAPDVYVTD